MGRHKRIHATLTCSSFFGSTINIQHKANTGAQIGIVFGRTNLIIPWLYILSGNNPSIQVCPFSVPCVAEVLTQSKRLWALRWLFDLNFFWVNSMLPLSETVEHRENGDLEVYRKEIMEIKERILTVTVWGPALPPGFAISDPPKVYLCSHSSMRLKISVHEL